MHWFPFSSKSDKLSSYHHVMDSNKASEALNGGGDAPKHREGVKQLDGYVGFANLPNQVYRKSVKRGFEFTLMVVGKSHLPLVLAVMAPLPNSVRPSIHFI